MDGANLNALLGKVRPGDIGRRRHAHQPAQDVHHAARRRRPGLGRRSASARQLEPFLPAPTVVKHGRQVSRSTTTARKSIGRLRAFFGNFGMFVRAYTYIREMGGDGPHAGDGARGAQRQLRARARSRDVYPLAVRQAVDARGRLHRQEAQEGDRRADARRRQAADRLRLPPADDLLPAAAVPAAPARS